MRPTHDPRASAGAKTVSLTPSQLLMLAQREHEEWLLDEALRETFPASDPIAVTVITAGRTLERFPARRG
ncbi:MAG TPA: hypothetical protein VMH26_10415 [Burkholderiales bacterium]|nr:hypothetical protein [Burkholderiales bacterium]